MGATTVSLPADEQGRVCHRTFYCCLTLYNGGPDLILTCLQFYENLTASDLVGPGKTKQIHWSTKTANKILRFCAKNNIAAGAYDAVLLADLMIVIGFDSSNDEVYAALLKKLLTFFKGNVTPKSLHNAVQITKGSEAHSDSHVAWATYTDEWFHAKSIRENPGAPAGSTIVYRPAVARPWATEAMITARILEVRNGGIHEQDASLEVRNSVVHEQDASTDSAYKLAQAQAEIARLNRELGKKSSPSTTFTDTLATMLSLPSTSIAHFLAENPAGFAKEICRWLKTSDDVIQEQAHEITMLKNQVSQNDGTVANLRAQIRDTLDEMRAQAQPGTVHYSDILPSRVEAPARATAASPFPFTPHFSPRLSTTPATAGPRVANSRRTTSDHRRATVCDYDTEDEDHNEEDGEGVEFKPALLSPPRSPLPLSNPVGDHPYRGSNLRFLIFPIIIVHLHASLVDTPCLKVHPGDLGRACSSALVDQFITSVHVIQVLTDRTGKPLAGFPLGSRGRKYLFSPAANPFSSAPQDPFTPSSIDIYLQQRQGTMSARIEAVREAADNLLWACSPEPETDDGQPKRESSETAKATEALLGFLGAVDKLLEDPAFRGLSARQLRTMTSNAFVLDEADIQKAIDEMDEDLRGAFYGKHTAEQHMRGGRGVAWMPDKDQVDILENLNRGLGFSRYPSASELGAVLQRLRLYSGYRPFDRRMALKVLRWSESRSPKRKNQSAASKAEVEKLVDKALDLIEEARQGELPSRGSGSRVRFAEATDPPLSDEHTPIPPNHAEQPPRPNPRRISVVPTVEREPSQLRDNPYYTSALSELRDLFKNLKPTADVDSMSEEVLEERVVEHIASVKKFAEKNRKAIEAKKRELAELKGTHRANVHPGCVAATCLYFAFVKWMRAWRVKIEVLKSALPSGPPHKLPQKLDPGFYASSFLMTDPDARYHQYQRQGHRFQSASTRKSAALARSSVFWRLTAANCRPAPPYLDLSRILRATMMLSQQWTFADWKKSGPTVLPDSDGPSADDSAIDIPKGERSPSRQNINANQKRARNTKKGVTETALRLLGLMIPAFQVLHQNMRRVKGSQIAMEALLAEGLVAAKGTCGQATFDALVDTFSSELGRQAQRPPKRKLESQVQRQPKRQKRATQAVIPRIDEPLQTPFDYQHSDARCFGWQGTGYATLLAPTQVGEQQNQQQLGMSSRPGVGSSSTPDGLNSGYGPDGLNSGYGPDGLELGHGRGSEPVDFRDTGNEPFDAQQGIRGIAGMIDKRVAVTEWEMMKTRFAVEDEARPQSWKTVLAVTEMDLPSMATCTPAATKFENLTLGEVCTSKAIRWEKPTKHRILVFCARHRLSQHVLHPRLLGQLMVYLGWDREDIGDAAYKSLAKRVARHVFSDITVKKLAPAFTEIQHGTSYTVTWRSYTDLWNDAYNFDLHGTEPPADDPGTEREPVTRVYLTQDACIKALMEMRATGDFAQEPLPQPTPTQTPVYDRVAPIAAQPSAQQTPTPIHDRPASPPALPQQAATHTHPVDSTARTDVEMAAVCYPSAMLADLRYVNNVSSTDVFALL
ncbi:hypothetical protein Tdes44962_MAKER08449 [Teratosphaeria destructans]|uniref:Uncharacterized protein n=1 Tax=Teratosphaeria destructans TaxID=418781 RepID=A0A9W7SWL0_9PEZI|nr:hypothetical protein Tdes44962_MAKER08449 [Teratosphaeria destructans]